MRISELAPFAIDVKPDEKCWGVMELDFLTPDYKAVHRYRVTYVIRNDKVTPYAQDLTAAGIYSHLAQMPPVRMYALGEHTVGESWDIVENVAHNRSAARDRLRELREKSAADKEIIYAYADRMEMQKTFSSRNPRTVASIERTIKDNAKS